MKELVERCGRVLSGAPPSTSRAPQQLKLEAPYSSTAGSERGKKEERRLSFILQVSKADGGLKAAGRRKSHFLQHRFG